MNPRLAALEVEIYADGADLDQIRRLADDPLVKGFTTNPTLMRKAGITDYKTFARAAIAAAGSKPISFEVFADDFPTMARQARAIAAWGPNVFVKIPVTNSQGAWSMPLIAELSYAGIKVNVTAVMTGQQVSLALGALAPETPAIISVFAGRIADTGRDPCKAMANVRELMQQRSKARLLWASPREIFNIWQAAECRCDIITLPPDMIAKLDGIGRSLEEYSLETVAAFYRDAQAAGYRIPLEPSP